VDLNGHHLVYDQYLGQMFNRLTRIELLLPGANVVDAYVFKLFGQRNLIRGRWRQASAMASVSGVAANQQQIRSALVEPEDIFGFRTVLTHVQETFAIAHELVHSVLARNAGDELRVKFEPVLEAQRIHLEKAKLDLADPAYRARYVQSLKDDRKTLEDRRGIPNSGAPFWELSLAEDVAEIERRVVLLRDPTLIEEGICDYFGAIAAAETMSPDDDDRPTFYAAATLGLLHLRLIQYLDNLVDDDTEIRRSDDFDQSVLRASLLRTGLRTDVAARSNSASNVAEFDGIATEFNRAHSSSVLDQVLTVDLPGLTKKFMAFETKAEVDDPAHQGTIREFLGFGGIPSLTRHAADGLLANRNSLSRELIDQTVARSDSTDPTL